jgi:hypothetical protein
MDPLILHLDNGRICVQIYISSALLNEIFFGALELECSLGSRVSLELLEKGNISYTNCKAHNGLLVFKFVV